MDHLAELPLLQYFISLNIEDTARKLEKFQYVFAGPLLLRRLIFELCYNGNYWHYPRH